MGQTHFQDVGTLCQRPLAHREGRRDSSPIVPQVVLWISNAPEKLRCLCDDRLTIIMVMSKTLPLAEVKAKFSEMVDRVEREHERITVTRNGRPAAVLLSTEDLAALEDTLELLSDPASLEQITAAREELASGRFISAEELRSKYFR